MNWEEELREEDRKMRHMRILVDLTAQILAQDPSLKLCEALRLVEAARTAVGRMFPGKEETFDLIIRPRLERIILERFQLTTAEPVN
ncbi:MAG: hypothetical protein NZ869_07390 [Thermoanaerobaculum sp.]|nr:hypothetical protein [Thermoanaerobaculum sp.]MDW7967156.1 hypothetical protein [Thermoanaerobaculum sp.]